MTSEVGDCRIRYSADRFPIDIPHLQIRIQADVVSKQVIGIAACAVVGLLYKQSQLLRSGNLIRIFRCAVSAIVGLGNSTVPARILPRQDGITLQIAFVVKHLAINEITAQVIGFRTTINITHTSVWIGEQSPYTSYALDDALVKLSFYRGDVLHPIGTASPSDLLNGLHRNLIRARINVANPRLTFFGIEIVKRRESIQSGIIPIHLVILLIDILFVAITAQILPRDDATLMPLDKGVAFHCHPIIGCWAVHKGKDVEIPLRPMWCKRRRLTVAVHHAIVKLLVVPNQVAVFVVAQKMDKRPHPVFIAAV